MTAAQTKLVEGIEAELTRTQLAQGFKPEVQSIQETGHTLGIVPLNGTRATRITLRSKSHG